MKMSKLCRKLMPRAHNGEDRGFCTRKFGHSGGNCGNDTCPGCGIKIKATIYSIVPWGARKRCRPCRRDWLRKAYNQKPLNKQNSGSHHTFPCGCSGFLPTENKSNWFASTTGNKHWGCRVTQLLCSSQASARKHGQRPIDKNISHKLIRKMMAKSLCWRCKKPLLWIMGKNTTPHLHHNHITGEVYGFTHPHCNLKALEREVDELRNEIYRLRQRVEVPRNK